MVASPYTMATVHWSILVSARPDAYEYCRIDLICWGILYAINTFSCRKCIKSFLGGKTVKANNFKINFTVNTILRSHS